MNKQELLSVMVKNGDRQIDLAEALGISKTRLSQKINEYRGAVFTQPEITAIRIRYHLTDAEVCAIFFNH